MRWLTIPLRREADALSARSRLRAWADSIGLSAMARTRVVTLGSELARVAVHSRDGSIEFGWDGAAQRPFCAVDLPSYSEAPSETVAEHERAHDGDGGLLFEVVRDAGRTRYRFTAPATTSSEDIQRAVGENEEATAVEMLKEQNLEMARMLGTLRDHEAELVRALDEARRNANEATAHALRLSEIGKRKDEFLAIASHDIRSPVAAAMGALELLGPTLPNLVDDQRHLLAVARRGMDAVVHLVANLLSTALIEVDDDESLPDVPVDFGLVAREIYEMSAVQARTKGVEMTFEGPEIPCAVRGDLMWLRQIIANLVNNAVKFTPKGGHVDMRVSNLGAEVLLALEDDGVGIPPDKVDRVFEKLTKLRPRGTAGERGTGIGLYVTKQLIDRMEGSVKVLARSPAGTRFEVRFQTVPMTSHVQNMAAPPP